MMKVIKEGLRVKDLQELAGKGEFVFLPVLSLPSPNEGTIVLAGKGKFVGVEKALFTPHLRRHGDELCIRLPASKVKVEKVRGYHIHGRYLLPFPLGIGIIYKFHFVIILGESGEEDSVYLAEIKRTS